MRVGETTHSGPPPSMRYGGEVGVVNIMLHRVHHGREHEDPQADEEQQTAHLSTQTLVTSLHELKKKRLLILGSTVPLFV